MNGTRLIAAAVLILAWSAGTPPSAQDRPEVITNGVGGGDWSDPAAWRGKKVPGPADDVVIRKGDVVVFDRDDSDKVTCNKLQLDPRGAMRFKTEAGKIVCCIGGGIEAYGPISLDGTRSAKDHLELRLVGEDAARRSLKLQKGGALLARGKPIQGKSEPTVVFAAPRTGTMTEDMAMTVDANGGSSVDLQNIAAVNVQVRAQDIDNTGAKPGEKLNIVGCRFSGLGRVLCSKCDTPVMSRNSFGHADPKRREGRALFVTECPLAEMRDNVVTGGFEYGVASAHGPDVVIMGNIVENCSFGIHLGHGSGQNVTRNTVRGCETGIDLYYANLVTLEENTVEAAKNVVRSQHATAQFTSLRAEKLDKDAVGILYATDGARSTGALTLLNCNLRPEQVKLALPQTRQDKPPVTALEYVVVAARGAPADAEVEMKTEGFKGEAEADLNVRNSPAPLGKGSTPLPQLAGTPLTLSPLVVKAWVVDFDGKVLPPPKYTLRVLAPVEKPGMERKVLGAATVQPGPDWFRAKPDATTPTVEVTLK
jgi:parallel beta-helix repeat protein